MISPHCLTELRKKTHLHELVASVMILFASHSTGGAFAAEIAIIDQECIAKRTEDCQSQIYDCRNRNPFGGCNDTPSRKEKAELLRLCSYLEASQCLQKIDIPTVDELKSLYERIDASQQKKWVEWLELLEKSGVISRETPK